jgi:hypothetical protein
MNIFDEVKKWFDKAKEDLRVASLLLNEEAQRLPQICSSRAVKG